MKKKTDKNQEVGQRALPTDSVGKSVQARRKVEGMTQEQLARAADIPYATLVKVESGAIKNPSSEVLRKISQALKTSTDSFLTPRTLHGDTALKQLFEDILSTLKPGDSMLISGVDERRYLKADRVSLLCFIERLATLGMKQKLLVREGDKKLLSGAHLEYRAVKEQYHGTAPLYVYGNKVAFLVWGAPIQAMVLDHPLLAEATRRHFQFMWDHAKPVRRK